MLACLLCAFIPNTFSFNVQCHHNDKQALLNFKQGVIDPSHMLSSWSTQLDCCQWIGVMCDNITNRVTQLTLPCSTTLPTYRDKEDKSHCLTGSIYLSLLLLELQFIDYLDLSNNDFLAIQFDYSLHSRHCHNNLFVAAPSPCRCLNSSTLRHLNLSLNKNLAINNLRWLSNISSLEYLNLGFIDLHKETNWLQIVTTLPSLSVLAMRSCQLQDWSLSLQYANFTALEVLNLSENEFNSGLPKWLFNLNCSISTLHARENALIGQLPKELLNLRQLKTLNLQENNLDGPIPDWLGELQFMQELLLANNMFSGSIPTILGNLSSLTLLTVDSNQLSGVVTEKHFAKLSELKALDISSSPPLTFDFDSHWIPPFQLEELDIAFAGPNIPMWFYTQRSIESLTISYSSFEAPSKFWNFVSRMTELHLEGNSINGNLSNVLLNSTFIDMSSNGLKGSLPRLSQNVAVVDLSNNSLSGDISPFLCDYKMLNEKTNLVFLDISRNHLSGGLTNCWKNWKSLVYVNLGSNNLSGYIPPSMGFLSKLTSLHLHENTLHGHIPPSLQNCHSLLIFNVRENNLSGNIPNWIPISVKALQLRSNNFSGKIPNEIGNMTKLESLDFSKNQLWGEIPESLSRLSFLSYLNLSYNNLTGKIPLGTQLQGFSELSYKGNCDLCGTPLTKVCFQGGKSKDTNPTEEANDGEYEFLSWFYIGIESGFVTGFLGVGSVIFLNTKWRHVYFTFLYGLRDRVYVMLLIKINSFCQTQQIA
ncbi:hypothetical protein Fmac_023758 [Flemingia macrophylla]|uniref:Leucine-rich repeat-containing N-terminal plant-type domain-containing protein n=1 Tax=Flemingia macrophylla TaxID=520843 RepID=A0ABD1LME8_9FABA